MRFFAGFLAVVSFASIFSIASISGAAEQFPQGPELSVTPGSLCQKPDSYRYPEHIPYCSRQVDTTTKRQIIMDYDVKFGYQIESMDRQEFKIDHFIPLCAGGANDVTNLWPQHKSVYVITDPLEPLVCNLMAAGKITQARVVELMHQAKTDLSQAPQIIQSLQGL